MGLFSFFKSDKIESSKEDYERTDRFPDVDWYCDFCGVYLNTQKDFDDHKYVWKCTECGRKSSISIDNIIE